MVLGLFFTNNVNAKEEINGLFGFKLMDNVSNYFLPFEKQPSCNNCNGGEHLGTIRAPKSNPAFKYYYVKTNKDGQIFHISGTNDLKSNEGCEEKIYELSSYIVSKYKVIKHNLDEKFNGAWTMYEMTMPNDIKIVGDFFPTMQKGGRFMTLAISKKNLMSKEGL